MASQKFHEILFLFLLLFSCIRPSVHQFFHWFNLHFCFSWTTETLTFFMYSAGDGINNYYFPVLILFGVIGNFLAFLVSILHNLVCFSSMLNKSGEKCPVNIQTPPLSEPIYKRNKVSVWSKSIMNEIPEKYQNVAIRILWQQHVLIGFLTGYDATNEQPHVHLCVPRSSCHLGQHSLNHR